VNHSILLFFKYELFITGEGNKMATNQTKLNRSIVDLLNFAGDTVSNNLIVASRQKIVEISENDLRKVRAIVNNSIQQSLTNGYGGVEKLINEIASVEEKTTKSKKRTRK
jgi:murein endopeptidase|tara:strand:- start:211 stop:540 length:330 start_codon:yes stop_codon:yes gene_type:complete